MLPFEVFETRLQPTPATKAGSNPRELPLHIAPVANEALYSWMLRLATRLGTSVHALAHQAFGVDDRSGESQWWCRPNPWLLARISDRTGVPVEQLRRTTLLHLEEPYRDDEATERFIERRYGSTPPDRRVFRFVGCRQCWQGDAQPYIRWQWLLGWMAVCPEHKTVLIDRCESCHSKLRVSPFQSVAQFSPTICIRCKKSLLEQDDVSAHPEVLRLQAVLLQGKQSGATSIEPFGRLTWPELVSLIDVLVGMAITDTISEEMLSILRTYYFDRRESMSGSGASMHDTSLSSRYGSLLFLSWMMEGWPESPGAQVGKDMLTRFASGKRNRISRHLGAKWADPWSPTAHDIPPEIAARLCQLLS